MTSLSDVTTGGANYMLGHLQIIIAGGGNITPEKWQAAVDESVAFQRRLIASGAVE